MPERRTDRRTILRSSAFRIALFAGIFVITASSLLFVLVYRTATDIIEKQMATAVEAQARALGQVLDEIDDGEKPVWPLQAKDEMFRVARDPAGRYLLHELRPRQDITGHLTVPASGNVAMFEDAARLDDSGVILFGLKTRGGSYVLVAQEDEHLSELREAMMQAFLFASLLILSFTVGIGYWLSWRALERINAMNRVAKQVMAGDMARRMPMSARQDEIDRLSLELNQMLAVLDRTMSAIRQVSVDIAHDMRSPLARLQQKLERLPAERTEHRRAHSIRQINDEVQRMQAMFGAMLRIAQVEGGVARQQFTEVDLSELLLELGEIYEPVFHDADKVLTTSIEDGISLQGDRALLLQMFANLLDNVIAHTPRGTTANLVLAGANGTWQASLTDNGGGIDELHHGRIFDRFYRVDKSRSSSGSGLGLALVKAVAEAHGLVAQIRQNGGVVVTVKTAGFA
ncbi:MAG: ATP-binding protein [Novosphingobium sp.]